jgi:hypothetical protein
MACWSGSSSIGCISIRVAVTLSVMSDSLPLQSSHSVFGVLFEEMDTDMVIIILSLWLLYLLTFGVGMGRRSACLCMF